MESQEKLSKAAKWANDSEQSLLKCSKRVVSDTSTRWNVTFYVRSSIFHFANYTANVVFVNLYHGTVFFIILYYKIVW